MKFKLSPAVLALIFSAPAMWAQAPNFSRTALQHDQAPPLTLAEYPAWRFTDSLNTTPAKPVQRSAGKAMLFSAVVPGTGQFYNKSWLKGLAFVGIEAGAIAINAIYSQRGNEQEDIFERYADVHWSEEEYWRSLADDAKERYGLTIDVNDRQGLIEYERAHFSHFLPDTKNQTYYENIGKYSQFNAGWDDSSSRKANQKDSANRESYTIMRKKANDQFKIATYGASTILINHVLSMFDAAYSTYRFNRAQAQATMGLEMQRHRDELLPALSVRMSW